LAPKKFHLGYFTKFGPTDWPNALGREIGTSWADGRFFVDQAVALERANFDFVMFEDGVSIADSYGGSMELDLKHAVQTPKQDPLPLLPLMAHATSHIGFVATASTSFYPPFLLARLFSTIDSLSGGRVGWNIVTSSETNAARNFGMDELPRPTVRYDIADEYLDLVCQLWDSWEIGAVVTDPTTGVYADHTKVHIVDFEGEHFRCRGPLNTMPSPQVRPVLCQAGGSDRGRDFAARHAEVVVGLRSGGIDGMRSFRADIRRRMEMLGRNPDDCKVLFLSPLTILPDNPDVAVAKNELEAAWAADFMLVMASSSMNLDLSKYDLDAPVDPNMTAGGHTSVLDRIKEAGRTGVTLREAMTASTARDDADLVGTPEQIAEQMITQMDEVGGDGFLIQGYGASAQIPAITDRLVPELQRAGAFRSEYTGTTLRHTLAEY
jgi:FMN-dependent oxidoreductase (nitrilotriacetate monooxygenase family)